ALLALLASWVGSHLPAAAVASSRSSYLRVNWPLHAWNLSCSSRWLIALTIVSVWPLEEPVRGSEETILIVAASPPAAGAAAAAVGAAAAGAAVAASPPAAGAAVGAAAGVLAPQAAIRLAVNATSTKKLRRLFIEFV